MTDPRDVEDMANLWRAMKMLSPIIIPVLCGFGSLVVYYLRSMATSMKNVGQSLVRIDETIKHHDARIDRLEMHNDRV